MIKADTALVPILELQDLSMHFRVTRGWRGREQARVRAVERVSLTLFEGETLSVVGESGCGKTTLGRCVMRIFEPTGGGIVYHPVAGDPVDLAHLTRRQLRPFRRDLRMVFQDPFSSLNPRMTAGEIVGECLHLNGLAKGEALRKRVGDLLEQVGLRREYQVRYPHAFSGGERQRLGIARALALNPRILVADEAVSALDVSVQAQTINLLKSLQRAHGLTYLFIAHDLSVVEYISDRVAVMYAGRLVELGPTDPLFGKPLHPYTEALLSAAPLPDPRLRSRSRRVRLHGEVADLSNPPPGCPFHPRCSYADGNRCSTETPALREIAPGRLAACHHAERLALVGTSRDLAVPPALSAAVPAASPVS
jgi:peptide/nickel transport system ATP-binding protein